MNVKLDDRLKTLPRAFPALGRRSHRALDRWARWVQRHPEHTGSTAYRRLAYEWVLAGASRADLVSLEANEWVFGGTVAHYDDVSTALDSIDPKRIRRYTPRHARRPERLGLGYALQVLGMSLVLAVLLGVAMRLIGLLIGGGQ